MAGNSQKNSRARIVPGLDVGSPQGSRVSKAADVQATSRKEQNGRKEKVQPASVEQRSNLPSPRGGRAGSASASAGRATPRSRQGSSSSSSTRKGATPRSTVNVNRPPGSLTRPPGDPRDVRFVRWLVDSWRALDARQQQRIFSLALLVVSLLLFASLTLFHAQPFFGWLNRFFLTFFGWSSYLLSLGLIAFALAQFVESLGDKEFVRWSMIFGLTLLWLLLLIESRLIMGPLSAGVLAEVLVTPLLGWGGAVHVVVIGLILVTFVMTFRITFGHVLLAAHTVQQLFSDTPRPRSQPGDVPTSSFSAFLGQRPQYSRYAASSMGKAGALAVPDRSASGKRRSLADVREEEDEDGDISFDADFPFEDEDDPNDDINLHKQQIGDGGRGARVPRALDPSEHRQAVRGARQQPLSFTPADDEDDDEDDEKIILKTPPEMEPLPPNPRRPNATRPEPPAPVKQRGGKAAKGQAQVQIVQQSTWKLPDLSLLASGDNARIQMYNEDTEALAKLIQDTLRSFRVDAEVRAGDISIGPTIIRFGIRPTGRPEMVKDEITGKMAPVRDATGQIVYESRTRVSRIMALQNDLALVLEAKTIRMEAPVPGRPYVGVEIPNKNSRLVTLREVLESKEYEPAKKKSRLAIALGKDVAGLVRIGDLARMPHLLIAGATGAGKSVMINVIIASILTQATPDDVRLLMVDPKMVELNMYNGIPHLLSPVVIEVDKVVSLLKNAIAEMEHRYRLFSQLGVRNLDGYRKMRAEKQAQGDMSLTNLPAIVIIIDELADLMMAAPEEVEGMICRLAQLARATGIHLVIATQRPSVDVITGLIKANIPTRISFMVSSAVDSRTIIDMGGAERLLGRGDMLYLPADAGRPERIQGAFLSDDEAHALADYWRQQVIEHAALLGQDPQQAAAEDGWELKGAPSSDDVELEDDLLGRAEEVVREYGRASISLLQRRLRIGYSRAARLIDMLEDQGIIGQSESGGRAREVYESGAGSGHRLESEGHSMADAVADIVAEERARDEFLRNQAARFQQQQQDHKGNIPSGEGK